MTRLLIISPSFNLPGGVSNYIKLLDQNLDREQFEIKHLSTGKTGSFWKNLFYPLLILIQLINLKRILKKFQPELVHINPSLTYFAITRDFLFLKTLKKEGCPVLFFIHGWNKNISNKFQYIFWKHYFKKGFDMADAIVVLANQFKKKLIDLGINADKIYVSSTMVESEKYLPEYKNFSRPYKILFCAIIKKEKGPFAILEAAPIVVRKFPNTKFIFVGKGKDLEKLKIESKGIGIDKNIDFTGYITLKEKIKIFKKSHVFVFPSSHGEGFPTVILEAMAAGMPIITTANAGLRDAIENGKQGLIIDSMPPRTQEISAKMIQLIKNKKVMEKMSENNLAEVKDKYDVKVVSKQIEEIYQGIIN